MGKIGIIIPYFGVLPNYFDIWYLSAIKSKRVDFIFYTDCKITTAPNIIVHRCSFESFRNKIQKKFEFKISLEKPYKICDFRPAYGFIFQEELAKYQFWGYCDIDLIFGDIDSYLSDDILSENTVIGKYGHFSIYLNNEDLRYLFMDSGVYPEKNYQEVFQSEDAFYFDEFSGMMLKKYRKGYKTYPLKIANFLPMPPYFNNQGNSVYIKWSDGKVYTISKDNHLEEYFYVHYSKRKFNLHTSNMNSEIIVTPTDIYIGCTNLHIKIKDIKYGKFYYYKYMLRRIYGYHHNIRKLIQRIIWSCDLKKYADRYTDMNNF